MSRRQRTTLIISVRIPLPAGMTQKRALELITEVLKDDGVFATREILVKLEGRETTYL